MTQTTEQVMEKVRKGIRIAEVLQLRQIGGERQQRKGELYQTTWGKKTAYGLYETVVELLK